MHPHDAYQGECAMSTGSSASKTKSEKIDGHAEEQKGTQGSTTVAKRTDRKEKYHLKTGSKMFSKRKEE